MTKPWKEPSDKRRARRPFNLYLNEPLNTEIRDRANRLDQKVSYTIRHILKTGLTAIKNEETLQLSETLDTDDTDTTPPLLLAIKAPLRDYLTQQAHKKNWDPTEYLNHLLEICEHEEIHDLTKDKK